MFEVKHFIKYILSDEFLFGLGFLKFWFITTKKQERKFSCIYLQGVYDDFFFF